MNRIKLCFTALVSLAILGCNKDFQNFTLPRSNSFDVNSYKRQFARINCEELTQVELYDDNVPPGSWIVNNFAVTGSGFQYSNMYPSMPGVKFSVACDSLHSISFWTSASTSASMYVDGQFHELIESNKGDSVTSSTDYMMHESAYITPGFHLIDIQFDSPNASFILDEIVVWTK